MSDLQQNSSEAQKLMYEKLTHIVSNLTVVSTKLDTVATRIAQVEQRLERVLNSAQDHSERINLLEYQVNKLEDGNKWLIRAVVVVALGLLGSLIKQAFL